MTKIDKQIASGEYFMTDTQKKAKLSKERREKQSGDKKRQAEERGKDYIAPIEDVSGSSKKIKTTDETKIDVKSLKSKIKKANKAK